MGTLIKNSLANLKGHKLRLAIAFIWIIIGITSIVFVSSVGNGLTELFKTSFETIKPRTSIIYYEYPDTDSGKSNSQMAYQPPLIPSDLNDIRDIDGVQSAETSSKPPQLIPGMSTDVFNANMTFYGNSTSASILTPNKAKYVLIKGRRIRPSDEGSRVIVITSENAKDLFKEDVDPIGKGVTINGLTFEVVGISNPEYIYDKIENKFKKAGSLDGKMIDNIVPQEAYNILTGANIKNGPVNSLVVTIREGYDMKTVNDEILSTLSDLHPKFKGEYKIQDRSTIQKSVETLTNGIDKFVGAVTIAAMILGGVGVMNIMYVSVMERNKEIGIRRALGAKSKTILAQFLIESVFITSIGGVLGVIVGYAVTLKAQSIMPFKPIPSINGFIYGVVCIVLTGIIFGLIPAYKASKVDPIKVIYK